MKIFAGDHGKGFAVVADEVRRLSVQSVDATTRVTSILGDIEQATRKVAIATEAGVERTASGIQLSDKFAETLTAINEQAGKTD